MRRITFKLISPMRQSMNLSTSNGALTNLWELSHLLALQTVNYRLRILKSVPETINSFWKRDRSFSSTWKIFTIIPTTGAIRMNSTQSDSIETLTGSSSLMDRQDLRPYLRRSLAASEFVWVRLLLKQFSGSLFPWSSTTWTLNLWMRLNRQVTNKPTLLVVRRTLNCQWK